MKQCTIILGAGASIEFVKHPRLTSDTIMKRLISKEYWHALSNQHPEIKPDVEQIIQLINKVKYENDNFENLIDVIDKICTLSNPRKYSDSLLIRSVNYISGGRLTKLHDHPYRINIPFYIRELIAGIVNEFNYGLGKNESSQKLIALQREFIRLLLNKCDNVSVHSLNYDDCILTSLEPLGFSTGFDDSGYFQKSEYQSSNKVISYLHGTPHFVPKFKYFSGNSAIVRYYKNSKEALKERWRLSTKHPGLYTDGVVHPDYNHFITTGRTKDIHFYNQPYASYYTRLAEDLDSADIIFIIGYSFGDEHINQLLSSIRWDNYPKSIIIVDYDNYEEEQITENIYKKLYNIIIKLEKQYFESYKEPINSCIIEQLARDNWAKIGHYELYYYNRGYESFLKEDLKKLIFNTFAQFL